MENFYSRITQRKNYLDISEEEKREYVDEYISETNLNLIDSIIDYHFIVKLPEFISDCIKNAQKSSDLDELDFEIKYVEGQTTFPEYSTFGPMQMYCEEFTCRIVVAPLRVAGKTGVRIHGSAKDLATIYYLELEHYGQRNSYKKDDKVILADYDEKDLEKKAYQLRVKRCSSDKF